MICPNCGTPCEDGAKFCPACGRRLGEESPAGGPAVSYCPSCGRPHEGNPPFCPSCGASLLAQNAGKQAQNPGQGPENGQNPGYGDSLNQYFPQSAPGNVATRSIPLYIVLTIVTCGLFGLYWFVCIVNDLNTAAGTPEDTNGVVVLLLNIVTCGIYGLYWMYKAGEKVSILKSRRGVPVSGNDGILYLVLQLFELGIINYCLIQNEINQYAMHS